MKPRKTAGRRTTGPTSGRSWTAGRGVAAGLLGAFVALAVGIDALQVGFFADDFHFLDIARRVPFVRALSGQWGIWPWYRPLSRELFFEVVATAGPAALLMAHGLALACLFGCAWLLWRIGRKLAGAPAAPIAAVLFVTYGFTKSVTAWPSGFQDLLAMLIVLMGVHADLTRRSVIAATTEPAVAGRILAHLAQRGVEARAGPWAGAAAAPG